MIRALIVDDERRARAYLSKLVAAHADVEVVGDVRKHVVRLAGVDGVDDGQHPPQGLLAGAFPGEPAE